LGITLDKPKYYVCRDDA